MKRFLLLSVIAFSYCFYTLATAQNLCGVQSSEVWFMTFPASDNLQGYYFRQDLSGDSMKKLLYGNRGAGYDIEFLQRRTNINTFNFNSALNLSVRDIPKGALLMFSNLFQATIIGMFVPSADTYDSDALLYCVKGCFSPGYFSYQRQCYQPR